MRRGSVTEGMHQKAKLRLGFLIRKPEHLEHAFLKAFVVNTDAATANFHAIDYQIVGMAFTLPGSVFSKAISSGLGLVKGWCIA